MIMILINEEKKLVFINELEQCLSAQDSFNFKPTDIFNFTTNLNNAFQISNKLNNVPKYVLDFCENNNLRIREILITYKLEHIN